MEEWKDIDEFPGYQVSTKGRVRTFWKKKHYPTGYGTFRDLSDEPTLMSFSDDGNGYLKLMLYCKLDGKRYCKKVHKLVAEAFIPNPYGPGATVDHIRSGREGKLDNSVENLRWLPRRDNIQKAYRDGMCDDRIARQKKPVIAIDLWDMSKQYYDSIGEAAEWLGLDRSSISHVLRGDFNRTAHYTFEYADREDAMLYGRFD